MAIELRQSTAVDVLIGPFVDEDDGKTEESGLTISQGDVLLSKNGQGLAQKNDATACAFDDHGCYNCELDATDTNTLGQLDLVVYESGALPVRHSFNVISAFEYDRKYTNNGNVLYGTVQAATATTIDLEDHTVDDDELNGWLLVVLTSAGKAYQARYIDDFDGTTNQRATVATWDTTPTGASDLYIAIPVGIASVANPVDANVTEWLGTAVNEHTAGYPAVTIKDGTGTGEIATTSGKIDEVSALTGHTAQTGDSYAVLGSPAGESIAADIAENQTDLDAILADTNELQTDDIPGTLATMEGKIDTIDGIVDDILVDTGTTLDNAIAALNDISVADILDAAAAVDGYTPRQVLAVLLAACAGELSGGGTATITIKNPAGTQTRITSASADSDGNRPDITIGTTGIT